MNKFIWQLILIQILRNNNSVAQRIQITNADGVDVEITYLVLCSNLVYSDIAYNEKLCFITIIIKTIKKYKIFSFLNFLLKIIV